MSGALVAFLFGPGAKGRERARPIPPVGRNDDKG